MKGDYTTLGDIDQQRAIRRIKARGEEVWTVPTYEELGSTPAKDAERWPVIRTGEREPISGGMRIGVGRRDNFTCRFCHVDCWDSYELDHIVPWSAGGSDKSDNLRVLCGPCNQDRSNFRDGTERRLPMPITFWCDRCYPEIFDHNYEPPILAFCVECRVAGLSDRSA